MFSQTYHLLRSRADGKYILAQPDRDTNPTESGYLLLFREYFEALSYLNTHVPDITDRFAVEAIPGSQLKNLMQRWGFHGVAVVEDPLLPRIQFLLIN